MAYRTGTTANVVYDETNDIYQMTSGLSNELGKVVFDIDPVSTYSFNYTTTINANPTGVYAGSNGYFEVRLGDIENGVTFFVDHSENGADLYVHHNSTSLCNLEIPNFKFNVSQNMEINCTENTFIITYDDEFIGDVFCSSNIVFNDGWLEFTACNVIGTTAILDDYVFEPVFTCTHAARFMNGISADDWDGITLDHINDCWWSNVDPDNSSNMHTIGSIGIGTTDPLYNLHVEGTLYATSYCNIALCEEDLKVQIPVGSIMTHFGNEYINDPTYGNIMGQTVNRADYIELANALGIPKSRTTFLVPSIEPTQQNADWNATSGVAQILNKPSIEYSPWTTSGTSITYNAGSVGIGKTIAIGTPSTPILDVSGSIHVNKTESGGPTRIYVASGCKLEVQGPESLDCHAAFGGVYYSGYMVSITGGLKVSGAFVVNMTVGAVGTYGLFGTPSFAIRNQGTTIAGSSLRWANVCTDGGTLGLRNSAPSGTWVLCGNTGYEWSAALGYISSATVIRLQTSMWYRIS